MPKVSVIIPVYNVEKYLRECLDSVVNQTLKDIEIICINDGSTDNSLEILNEYAFNDSRISILTQNNKGAGAARNSGIKIANGDFIAFIDPDDIYPSANVLSKLYNAACQNNALVCGGSLTFFKDKKFYPSRYNKSIFSDTGFVNFVDYQFDYFYQRYIYNTKFLKNNNLYFPMYRRYQDAPFFLNVMAKCEKFYAIPDVTYAYFESQNGNTTNSKKVYDMLRGLAYCLDLSRKHRWYVIHYEIAKRVNGAYYKNIFKKQVKKLCFPVLIQLFITVSKLDFNIINEIDKNFFLNNFISCFTFKGFFKNLLSFSFKSNTDKYVIKFFGIKLSLKKGEMQK